MDDGKTQALLQGGSLASVVVGAGYAGITFVTEGAVDWRSVWIVFFIAALPWAIYVYLGQHGYVE